MIFIAILTKEQARPDQDLPAIWACWLQLTDSQDTLYLPATAPIDTKDLAAHFQAQAERLWTIAQQKGHTDPLSVLPERVLLKAIARATDLSEAGIIQAVKEPA